MESFISDLSVVLVTAAILSTLAFFFRQPIIIGYVVCGIIIGPWGFKWIKHVEFIEVISHLGITLLLFLAGLNLHPQKLIRLFKNSTLVTFANCIVSFALAFGTCLLIDFTIIECICVGLALMFSSTILVVKLLPTTDLHHKHIGATCIGVLILQDLLAVAVLVFVRCLGSEEPAFVSFFLLSFKLVLFIALLLAFEYFVLRKVMASVDRLQEIVFILSLAWCFGIASVSNHLGLFFESGAFFAGVVLARQNVSRFIAESLKPLRDFFLVLFFFTLGAKLDLYVMKDIFPFALFLAVAFVATKPFVFMNVFMWSGEKRAFSKEAGFRLGQLSEFSLLIAILANELNVISVNAAQFIQLVTIITFIFSSYIIVFKYPTPIGVSEKLTRV